MWLSTALVSTLRSCSVANANETVGNAFFPRP
jgi:hypothetical protein